MRFLILLALFSSTSVSGERWVLPRLPLSLLLRGDVHLIDADRIVGGSVVVENSLPFQVSLQSRSGSGYAHICGGSIYNSQVILCASHCVDGARVSYLQVVAGEHSLSQTSGNEQIRQVSRYTMHQSYNAYTYANDISLIFLSSPLTLNDKVAAIDLPAAGQQTAPGTALVVSGWGTTSEGGSVSNLLRRVSVPAISDDECRVNYGTSEIKDSMICAGVPLGGIDACQGDSGGPLFTENPFTLIGIVSWGTGCARPGYPGVYTEVSYFVNWITSNSVL